MQLLWSFSSCSLCNFLYPCLEWDIRDVLPIFLKMYHSMFHFNSCLVKWLLMWKITFWVKYSIKFGWLFNFNFYFSVANEIKIPRMQHGWVKWLHFMINWPRLYPYSQSLLISCAVSNFYGTEIRIWAGFGQIGSTTGIYRRSTFTIRPNILIGLQKLRLRPKDRSQLFIYLIF